jgi:hypothetical protein
VCHDPATIWRSYTTLRCRELLAAVTELRGARWAYSWSQIAGALGISKQAAAVRFRKAGGIRSPGGQPSALR